MTIPRPAFKIWIETDNGYVFGPGVYALLLQIKEKGTLKDAASSLEMSYRYAWGLVKKAEEKLEMPLIETQKGGRYGGGSTKITELGYQFIEDFKILREKLYELLLEKENQTGNETSARITFIENHSNYLELRLTSENNLVSSLKLLKNEFTNELQIGEKLELRLKKD
jgi:molybdate transport repressor ModE-like protein